MSSRETPIDVAERAAAEHGVDAAELTASVDAALARLSPQARQLAVLRYFADLSERRPRRSSRSRPAP
jgi:DNA-directed RNA polymerase specialized sigma24 family protein